MVHGMTISSLHRLDPRWRLLISGVSNAAQHLRAVESSSIHISRPELRSTKLRIVSFTGTMRDSLRRIDRSPLRFPSVRNTFFTAESPHSVMLLLRIMKWVSCLIAMLPIRARYLCSEILFAQIENGGDIPIVPSPPLKVPSAEGLSP